MGSCVTTDELGAERNERECDVRRQQEGQDHFDEVLMLPAQPQCAMTDTLTQVERVCSQACCWRDPADG